jgi:hypothetical protein
MNNEIIVVKQLPIIQEQLQQIKADVTSRVETALSLVCTEDTVKTVKEVRANLNKEAKEWEEKRKEVKKAIMTPYEQFEEVYKDCISDNYKKADNELKVKIDSVETELKEQKKADVKAYFEEYLASKNITMPLTFECANINVTLSASLKSLKEQAKAFIDRVCDDLNLIATQEYKEEIYHEYNTSCFLNVSGAITTVVNRRRSIEEAKAREAELRAKAESEQKAVKKVAEVLTPPTVESDTEKEAIYTVSFKVKGTKAQLRVLKEFLNNGGYIYE